ncbi:hypothetical protein [Geodermatophilus sp. URMC 62]|uniref:hypothetical protein n=1 Tax=Geodermatophilus sp. URMC 62 TaxID=3423414 RepID=UPI00406CB05F
MRTPHYLEHGAAKKQNEILLRIATALVGGYQKTDDEAIDICWKFLQQCENTDDTWPWTRKDAERKVRQQKRYVAKARAKKQAEKQAEKDEAVELLNNFLKGIQS